jgi:hypothetical protein
MQLLAVDCRHWLAALAALSLLAACASDKLIPATQLFVSIDSDLEVGSQLSVIKTTVLDGDGKKLGDHAFEIVKSKPSKNQQVLPFTFGVLKGRVADVRLVVTGYAPDDDTTVVVERKLNVRFQDRKTLEFSVFLSKRCLDTTCGADETCRDEGSRAASCGAILDADVTVRDAGGAGKDAGADDAGEAGTSSRAGAGGSAGAGGRMAAGSGGGAGGTAGTAAGAAGTAGTGISGSGGSSGNVGAAGSGGMCAPSCGGKKCGPDGCNGSCGTCASTEKCEAGNCVCVPSCAGKRCGPDGCGGTCGTCGANENCVGATCVCTPSCTGKECGPDGCGGQCGQGCNPNTGSCVSGVCKGICDAVYRDCNCGIAPSQVEGSSRPEPACANGDAILHVCSGFYCFDPDTGAAVSMQWGETCDCN